MRKHFGVVIVVLIFASLLTACVMPDGQMMATDGSGAAEVQTEAKDWPLAQDLRICHIIELGHPYSTAKVTLAEKEANVFGFQYDVYDTQGDIPNEIRLIEDCITKQYDVIALVPYDMSALNDALREAQEAGIPVIAEGADLDEEGLGYVNTMIGSSGLGRRRDGRQGRLPGPGRRSGLGHHRGSHRSWPRAAAFVRA